MKRLILLACLSLPIVAKAEVLPVVAQWDQHHPVAAAGLSSWIQQHPDVAGKMFGWNRYHPLRGQDFVLWMARHPEQGLDDFIAAHADWPIMDLVFKPNREALISLVSWGHTHAAASMDLAVQPRGFAWVGFHTFRALWDPTGANTQEDVPADDTQGE